MKNQISEIQIVPIKPENGLIGFANLVYDNSLYLGSIGIYTRPEGGFRLTYPTKKLGEKSLNIFNPISRKVSDLIEKEVIKKFNEIFKANDITEKY